MAKKDSNTQLAWKKKKWYELIAPELFARQSIGFSLLADPKSLLGKSVKVNLMNLTKNIKKQHINVTFKVTDIIENKGQTTPVLYEIVPSSIKRLVRSGRDRIDDSFLVKTQDEQYVRIKPLLITRSHEPAALISEARRIAVTTLRESAKEITYEQLFKQIVEGTMQKQLKDAVQKKVFLRTAEIRVVSLVQDKKK
ncbi:MAG: hypothetical protein ACMXYF_02715 [Candidatus Woesearchaeota archaeon]